MLGSDGECNGQKGREDGNIPYTKYSIPSSERILLSAEISASKDDMIILFMISL